MFVFRAILSLVYFSDYGVLENNWMGDDASRWFVVYFLYFYTLSSSGETYHKVFLSLKEWKYVYHDLSFISEVHTIPAKQFRRVLTSMC